MSPIKSDRRAWAWITVAVTIVIVGAILLIAGLPRSGQGTTMPLPPITDTPSAASLLAQDVQVASDPTTGSTSTTTSISTTVPAPSTIASKSSVKSSVKAAAVSTTGSGSETSGRSTSTSSSNTTTRQPAAPSTMASDSISLPTIGQEDVPVGTATVTADGVLEPPSNVRHVGWWTGGSAPSASAGLTVITGHVNWSGQGLGAFYDIAGLHTGDLFYTSGSDGKVTTWRVTNVTAYLKTALPWEQLFDTSGPRRVELITCGGKLLSTGSYDHNVVVTASLA